MKENEKILHNKNQIENFIKASKFESRAAEMEQKVSILTVQTWRPEFGPQTLHQGVVREPLYQVALWLPCTHMYACSNNKYNFKTIFGRGSFDLTLRSKNRKLLLIIIWILVLAEFCPIMDLLWYYKQNEWQVSNSGLCLNKLSHSFFCLGNLSALTSLLSRKL